MTGWFSNKTSDGPPVGKISPVLFFPLQQLLLSPTSNIERGGGVCVSALEKCEIIGRRGAAPGGCTRCHGGLMIVLGHATCLNKDECVFDSALLFVGHDLDFPTVWSHYRGMTAINKLLDCSWHCVYEESVVLKCRRPFGITVTKFYWIHGERRMRFITLDPGVRGRSCRPCCASGWHLEPLRRMILTLTLRFLLHESVRVSFRPAFRLLLERPASEISIVTKYNADPH